MAARVLHIGEDDCHRISILESAGYDVQRCGSLREFQTQLQTGSDGDAIFVTECDGVSPTDAAVLARSRSPAPLILFRTTNRRAPEKRFDLIVDSLEPPEQWLKDVDALIAKSRKLRAQSATLIEESRQLRRESAEVRMQSRQERARSRGEYSRGPQKS